MLASASVGVMTFALATSAHAEERQVTQFNIPGEDMPTALEQFGKQSGKSVIFNPTQISGRVARPLRGGYDPSSALRLLLDGSGLVARNANADTYVVEPRPLPVTKAAFTSAVAEPQRQSEAAAPTVVDDVVVTALRRESSVQKIPISIVALTGQTLAQTGVTGLADYFRQVPSLNVTSGSGGSSRISIRGINGAGEATTGLYYGETPVTGPSGTTQDAGSNAADVNLFDVDRVEVLRGPQGTLYGASSMAGTLRIIFKQPNPTRYEAAAEARFAETQGGTASYFVKGMINAPLIEDRLAVRLAAYTEKRPGYVDNIRYGTKNIDKSDSHGVRALVGFTPDSDTSITTTVIYQKTTADDAQGWYPSLGKYKTNSPSQLPFDTEFQLYNLVLNRDFGLAKLTTSASFYRYDIVRSFDFTPNVAFLSQSPGACASFFLTGPCTPAQLTDFKAFAASRSPAAGYQPANLRSQNYEARLSSPDGAKFEWTVGAYYDRRHDHIDSNVTSVSQLTGAVPNPLQDLSYRYVETIARQVAGFGDLTTHVTDKFTIDVGARYYDYRKTVSGAALLASPLTASVLTPFSQTSTQQSGWIEKASLNYKFTPKIMAYATASKGFRPGGVNNVPGLPANLVSYQPDSLWTYEAGLKSSWLNDALTANFTVLQIDWSNIQTQARTQNGLFAYLTNAGHARVRGAEGEIVAHPIVGLTLSGAASYMDARLTEDQSSASTLITGASGRAGDRIPFTPDWTASASANYVWPVSDRLDARVRVDYAYTGSIQSTFHRVGDPFFLSYGTFSTVNARLGVETRKWSAAAFVENLTNSQGLIGAVSSLGSPGLSWSVRPRTAGVTVSANF